MWGSNCSRRWLVVIFPAALFLCGCVRESVDAATKTHSYAFEYWVTWPALIGGLAAMVYGGYIVSGNLKGGLTALGIGAVAAFLFGLSMMMDVATVSPDRYEHRSGFFGKTAHHELNFAEITAVSVISREETGRRGRKVTRFYLQCEKKDGSMLEIPINNEVAEAAAPALLDQIEARGIPINNKL